MTPAVADGDVVGRWEDLSAHGYHANQTNAALKPTLQNGVGDLLNNNPAIRADGIDDFLSVGDYELYSNVDGMTVFAVFTSSGDSQGIIVKYDASVGKRQYSLTSNQWNVQDNAGAFDANNVATYARAGGVAIHTCIWEPNVVSRIYLAGVVAATAITPAVDITNTDQPIKLMVADGSPDIYLSGDVYEILHYGARLSGADLDQVRH